MRTILLESQSNYNIYVRYQRSTLINCVHMVLLNLFNLIIYKFPGIHKFAQKLSSETFSRSKHRASFMKYIQRQSGGYSIYQIASGWSSERQVSLLSSYRQTWTVLLLAPAGCSLLLYHTILNHIPLLLYLPL